MTEGADEYDAMISPPKRLTYRWLTPALRNGDILLTAGWCCSSPLWATSESNGSAAARCPTTVRGTPHS